LNQLSQKNALLGAVQAAPKNALMEAISSPIDASPRRISASTVRHLGKSREFVPIGVFWFQGIA
jgi:hypothetical protein